MMNNRYVTGAATLSLLTTGLAGVACAEEVFQSTTPSGALEACRLSAADAGCTHFEGYVYVRRGPAEAPALSPAGKTSPESSLGDERLYIRLGVDETR